MDDTIARTEAQLDRLIIGALRCAGGHHLHPVGQRGKSAHPLWTCAVPGCSRMLADTVVRGLVAEVLVRQGIPYAKLKDTLARYRKFLTGGHCERP